MAVSRRIRDAVHYQTLVREDDYYKALAELSFANKGIRKPTEQQLKIEILFLAHKYPRNSVFFTDISEQERICLLLSSWGLEVEEIAEILILQPNSVLKVRGRILQKLNAKNITHAITKANQAGILNVDSSDLLIQAQKQKKLYKEDLLEETENASI